MPSVLTRSALVALLCLVAAAPAAAQPQPPPAAHGTAAIAAELERLRAEVLENRRLLSQVPGAVTALADLESRLGLMQAEVQRLSGMRQTEADLRRELDQLRAGELEVRTKLAQIRLSLDEHRVPLPRPAGFGHDREGFFFRTDDGRYELRLGGYVQPGWEGARRSTEAPHDYATYDLWRNLSAFSLRRAKLTLGGHAVKPWIQYYVELDFARMGNPDFLVWHDQTSSLAGLRSPLLDYYVDLGRYAFAALRVGQFRVPFGREHQIPEDRLLLVDRSITDNAFTFDRDIGLMLHGAVMDERLGYQAAVLNGTGPNQLHNTGDLLYVARLVLSPLGPVSAGESDLHRTPRPRLAAGGSFAYRRARLDSAMGALGGLSGGPAAGAPGALGPGRGSLAQVYEPTLDRVDIYQAGAELAAKWRGATFQGEYIYRRQINATGSVPATWSGKTRFKGYYAQAGYMVCKRHLEVAGRFAYAEPPAFGVPQYLQRQLPESVYEGTLGTTYYVKGEAFKLVLDGSYLKERAIAALDPTGATAFDRTGWRARLMLQLKF
ncbi:MAG TPA: porin [Polyangia bacterium]